MPQPSVLELYGKWQRMRHDFSKDTGMRIDVAAESMFALLSLLEQMNDSGLSASQAEIETHVKGIVAEIVSAACSLTSTDEPMAGELRDKGLFSWKDALYGAWCATSGCQSTPKRTSRHDASVKPAEQHPTSMGEDDIVETVDLSTVNPWTESGVRNGKAKVNNISVAKSMEDGEYLSIDNIESEDEAGNDADQAPAVPDEDRSNKYGPHPGPSEGSKDDDSDEEPLAKRLMKPVPANVSTNKSTNGATVHKPATITSARTVEEHQAGRGDLRQEDKKVKPAPKRGRESASTAQAGKLADKVAADTSASISEDDKVTQPPSKRKRGLGSLCERTK